MAGQPWRRGRALALAAFACTAIACDWPWRHDMVTQPSPATTQGPRSAVKGTLPLSERGPLDPQAGERVGNPLAADPTAVDEGRALYRAYCVPCHGTTGSGVDAPVAKYFPRVGDLASSDIQAHGDGWLYATISIGTTLMPAYGHELDTDERWQVVRFLRTLGR